MQMECSPYELALQAEAGDVSAQYRLGVLFLMGESVEQDTEAAFRWLMRAASGKQEAAHRLAAKLAPLVDMAESEQSHGAKSRILLIASKLSLSGRSVVQRLNAGFQSHHEVRSNLLSQDKSSAERRRGETFIDPA